MSLSDDFGMYYGGTYVGYRLPYGRVVPFNVESVSHDNNIFDLRSVPREDRDAAMFSDEALGALQFYGTIMKGPDNYESVQVNHDDPRLVLDLPDSKFIKYRGRYYWISYRAQRSTKKGVTNRRLTGLPNFNWEIMYLFFSNEPLEGVKGGVFLKTDDDLRYKDVYIGKFLSDTSIELFAEAAHLQRAVTREVTGCQVTVQSAD